MRKVRYSKNAVADLLKYRASAHRLKTKIDRYAETGAGDVKALIGSNEKRLRDGDFRIVFVENETEIQVIKIAPRGRIYER